MVLAVEKCPACGNLYSLAATTAGGAAAEILVCPNCGATRNAGTADRGSSSSYPGEAVPPAPLALPPYYQEVIFRAGQCEQLAQEQVAMPAMLLLGWGALWMLMALAAWGIAIAAAVDGNDPLLAIIVFAAIGLWLAISGALVFISGLCLRRLRRYRLTLGLLIYGMVAGTVLCLPLSLLGIWPLALLLRPKVRAAFDAGK